MPIIILLFVLQSISCERSSLNTGSVSKSSTRTISLDVDKLFTCFIDSNILHPTGNLEVISLVVPGYKNINLNNAYILHSNLEELTPFDYNRFMDNIVVEYIYNLIPYFSGLVLTSNERFRKSSQLTGYQNNNVFKPNPNNLKLWTTGETPVINNKFKGELEEWSIIYIGDIKFRVVYYKKQLVVYTKRVIFEDETWKPITTRCYQVSMMKKTKINNVEVAYYENYITGIRAGERIKGKRVNMMATMLNMLEQLSILNVAGSDEPDRF